MDRPIAVVGIGARLPGGRGPAGVWRMLGRRETEIGSAPESRARFLAQHDVTDPGFAEVCRTGGFVDGWEEFDHPAFGISAREAEVMDPQQRVLLETAFEAIGDAGLTLDYLQRRTTGVVTGCITRDYWLSARHDAGLDAMSNVGNTGSGLSGRLSHVFGLSGPSITIDTACSSGLAAVGTAIDNILTGNCSVAIAAATNLVLDPYETLSFHRSGMLAADGRCKFGTTRADGFVRSDGFVAVVLRPLEDALAERDRVYAVIEAVATGNDAGRSGSLVTPSADGQVEVVRRALALAGRAPAEVGYVEAHGTGTTVGDQVELDALATVFAGRARPLPVGSVKTRIGHCEATSGLAGLVVAALSLSNSAVPPMLAHGELRAELADAGRGLFAHVDGVLPLPDDAVIGVSSFGITGTNAHAVLAAPPRPADDVPRPRPSLPRLTSAGVAPPAGGEAGDRDRVDAALAYRLNHSTGRRRAGTPDEGAVTTSGAGLIAGLWRETPKLVFAFGGFGAHWLDPAAVADPILRAHLDTGYAAVRDRLPEGERHLLDGGDAVPAALQPYATWASQLAIAFTLTDYGVRPDAVLGHSFGDIAAACVAGALDADTAADLLVARTEAVRAHSGDTRMIVITGEDVARDRAWIPPSADVAVVNSPGCVVLACPAGAVDAVTELAVAQGHEARALEVTFGSHSRFVEPAIPAFTPVATAIGRDRTADVPFYSSTTTAAAVPQTAMAPGHWLANLRVPVELPPVAARLAGDGHGVILDIGPRAVLAGHLRAQFSGTVLATDALDGDDFLRAVIGALHAANVPLRPDRLPPWTSELATALAPRLTPRTVPPLRPAGRAPASPRPAAEAEPVTFRLSGRELGVLAGHQVNGEIVVPGTLTLSHVVRALQRDGEALRLDSVRFVEAIVIDDDTDHLALTVTRTGPHVEVHFTTDPAAAPVLCCTATAATAAPAGSPEAVIDLPLNLSPLPVEGFYRDFAAAGNLWDGPFRSITELWASTSHAYVTAELGEPLPIGGEIDAALFDAALHGLAAVHYGMVHGAEPRCPFYFEGVDRMTFHRHRLRGRVRSIVAPAATGAGFDIAVLDAEDRLAVRCEGVRIRPLENRPAIPALWRSWVPLTGAATGGEQRVFDLFGSPLGLGDLDLAEMVAGIGAGRELLVDARTFPDRPAGTMTDDLAGLGLVLTRLARTAAEAGVPLGIVVADVEHPPAGEFAAAGTAFLFSLAGALPAEIPSLAVAVVSVAAGEPLGELPSIRELSVRGEHRVRRDGAGALQAARLTDRPPRSRPPYSHPRERHLDQWSAEVRLDPARACDLELVWSDPDRGPRGIGVRPLPGRYSQAQRMPDVLWAAHTARRIVEVARLSAGDDLLLPGDSDRAALLRAAIAALTTTAYPGAPRRVGVALGAASKLPDVDLLIGGEGAALTLPELAPASTWPRSLGHRSAPAEIETTLARTAPGTVRREDDRPAERTARRRAALIAGGYGGLGSALAADLAARGFEEIILVGTREDPGGPFGHLRCDIGAARAADTLYERLSRVKADEVYVFHLAGRLSAGPLTELERADWTRVLGPKVDGTRNLVEAAERAGAHMLVAYSSASAVLASPQFAHYGAANAALEGILAAAGGRVRVRGVRWGFWAGAGMLRDLDPTRSFTPAGVQEIGADDGHAFLWNVMAAPRGDLPVCYPADWAELGGRYDVLRRDALLHELRPVGDVSPPPAETARAEPAGQATSLESLIMDTLKISDVAVVRGADRLRAIGLDSLLAVELRTKIKSAFGHTVPMRTLLGPITTEELHALVTDAEARSA
ncbi:type I polyketide synthase [Actinomadura sp. DC4]|uniref:type I polyketide synthase n=1 Tax=Actinomadura sp. DC4 TaxID=3055069 RepID=UPI0025B17CF0|nr:type I polyketide synthase [Actinomadura sp. DC4]MDN3353227.1 SDR family oxidoreductase [Actinomadura sp. DC4]